MWVIGTTFERNYEEVSKYTMSIFLEPIQNIKLLDRLRVSLHSSGSQEKRTWENTRKFLLKHRQKYEFICKLQLIKIPLI